MAKLVLRHEAKLSKIKQMWHLQMVCSKFAIEVNPFFRPVLYHGRSTFTECRWGWSANLPVLNHKRFNFHCHAIDVLKWIARWMNVLSIITWKSLLSWASVILWILTAKLKFLLGICRWSFRTLTHYYTVYPAGPIEAILSTFWQRPFSRSHYM